MNKRLLLTGATGLIGRHIEQHIPRHLYSTLTSTRSETVGRHQTVPFDVRNIDSIPSFLELYQPNVIVHTAAVTAIEPAERNPEEATLLNVEATRAIAEWCREKGARLLHFSTDFVFPGKHEAYAEGDSCAPLSHYGRTKLLSEAAVRDTLSNHVIVRPILVYGWALGLSRMNLPLLIRQRLGEGVAMNITADQFRKPTYAGDVAKVVMQLLDHSFQGTLHVCGNEYMSVYDMALEVARVYDFDASLLKPVISDTMPFSGLRPQRSGFDTSLLNTLMKWEPTPLREALEVMKMQENGLTKG